MSSPQSPKPDGNKKPGQVKLAPANPKPASLSKPQIVAQYYQRKRRKARQT